MDKLFYFLLHLLIKYLIKHSIPVNTAMYIIPMIISAIATNSPSGSQYTYLKYNWPLVKIPIIPNNAKVPLKIKSSFKFLDKTAFRIVAINQMGNINIETLAPCLKKIKNGITNKVFSIIKTNFFTLHFLSTPFNIIITRVKTGLKNWIVFN